MAQEIGSWNINGNFWTIPEGVDGNLVENDRGVEVGNLTNPPIISEQGESSSDGTWTRSVLGYLRPIAITDKVIVGGTSFISTERFRVIGDILGSNVYSQGILGGDSLLLSTSDITAPSGTFSFILPEKSGTFAMLDDMSSIEWSAIINGPSSSVGDIDQTVADSHIHSNKALLDSLGGFTNTEILDTITASHTAVTLGTPNGLSLSTQQLSLALSSTNTTGALSLTDWNTFNDKLDSTDTLSAIKDLVLDAGSIIIGNSSTTASLLTPTIANATQLIAVNSSGDGYEFIDNSISTINWANIVDGPISAVIDIDQAVDYRHTHNNFPLLNSLYGWTNDQILALIASGGGISLGTPNGLTLSSGVLSLGLSSTSTTGALSDTDWNTFNDKLSSTTVLTAIKDLSASELSLIYFTDSTTATILGVGNPGEALTINLAGTALEWGTPASSGLFVVPDGFTEISNQIGDINNTNYPSVSSLDSLTQLEVLQQFLFTTNPVGIDADTVDGKHAASTMDSSSVATPDPTTGSDITDHINRLYTLNAGLTSGVFRQASVLDVTTTVPGSPVTNGRYAINGVGTGDWVGHDGDIATYSSGWTFEDPADGWVVSNQSNGHIYVYNATYTDFWKDSGGDAPYLSETVDGIVSQTWYTRLLDLYTTPDNYLNSAITPTDNILDWDQANLRYSLYSSLQSTSSLSSAATPFTGAPHGISLNYNGQVICGSTNSSFLETGLSAYSYDFPAISATAVGGIGALIQSTSNTAITAISDSNVAISAISNSNPAISADSNFSTGPAIYASNNVSGIAINTDGAIYQDGERLVASQSGNSGKVLSTNGTRTEWIASPSSDERLMGTYYYYRQTLGVNTSGDVRVMYNTTARFTEQYNGSSWIEKEVLEW